MLDTIATIAGKLAPVATLLALIGIYYTVRSRFEKTERGEKARHKENTMIIKALFACLDGLHQQGCNGEVTKCHKELNDYIIDKRE